MKHTFFLFISLLSVVFGKAQEKADFQSDEFLYAFNASGVTVVGQTKTGYKMTEVTIPETVEFESQKYIVTKIGNNAFGYNQNLVKVTMGDGVKAICESAFEACGNLKRITLSKTLEDIGTNAFLMCVNLDSVVLPQTIKKIGDSSFYHNSRLKDIYCLATEVPQIDGLDFCTYGYFHVLKGYKQLFMDNSTGWDYFYEIVDDIDPESFESETKNNKDDAETNKNDNPNKDDNPSKDDDLNKDDNPNKDSGSTSDNTGTTGGSNSTDNPDSNKDEEKELSTAIREISTMQSQKAFSLTGVRRDSPLKGINIINGKKILVR